MGIWGQGQPGHLEMSRLYFPSMYFPSHPRHRFPSVTVARRPSNTNDLLGECGMAPSELAREKPDEHSLGHSSDRHTLVCQMRAHPLVARVRYIPAGHVSAPTLCTHTHTGS